ncbi:Fpg/Nei family DNA glycosylase [Salsipaludibacter albus]|uniref:Fpg/Nei family DNA glycosylase n=1 Tax=Salsipaludibacter albus TaxID=2849650 RepID=UPI001EE49AE9|nr:DNA-formamidopyrimidine glycosylase family protein [Salsipaludibacter albus]MBY5161525.1 Fpg/Nei family DNA glycosylase [Salsipaludibacter albus]
MPEGHTLHRLARHHDQWFAGTRVRVTSPQQRFDGADLVDGHVLERASAYGKHLFHDYDTGGVVHVHLGLFGRFFTHHGPPPTPRQTARMRVSNRTADADDADADDRGHTIDLVGATACELLTPDEVSAIIDRLGPDPLRSDADPDKAWAALQRRRVGIGRALMDQAVLAGVGNVYRAEVLHVYGLHPEVPAAEVPKATWDAMWDTLVEWMRYGTRYGRIVTTDPDVIGRPRSRMRRDQRVHVYKRDHCRDCGTDIRRWDLAGRWAYACETCQPPPPRG